MAVVKHNKKVEVADCLQFTGNNRQEMINFCPGIISVMDQATGRLRLYFMGMEMNATDWMVQYPAGAFRMWNDTQFTEMYEPAA
jgi:hypothetical protein